MTAAFKPASTIGAADAPPPPAGVISVDDFWPSVNLDDMRKKIRIDGAVTVERFREVATNAILDVVRELHAWRLSQVQAGHTSLDDVPAQHQIDGRSNWNVLWSRAIQSAVAVELAEKQLSQAARAAGLDRADDFESDIDIHRRNLRHALRDFLGRSRIIAEAI